MITVEFSKQFVKHFNARIKPSQSLHRKFDERVKLFMNNPSTPILRNHKLVGRLKDFAAFSVTGDVRVIYSWESQTKALFIDIGTHNQVYS